MKIVKRMLGSLLFVSLVVGGVWVHPYLLPYTTERDLPVINPGIAEFYRYPDLKALNDASEIVAEVEVIAQQTVQKDDLSIPETRSQVQVIKPIKGVAADQTLNVYETGGPAEASVRLAGETGQQPKRMVDFTMEWSPVMSEGGQYLLFLIPSSEPGLYTLTGSVQGKLKIDKETEEAVVTIPREHIRHEHLYWLQQRFGGKHRDNILNAVEKIQD